MNSWLFLVSCSTYTGDRERGVALAERAKQLNPNHPGWYWFADFYTAYRRRDYRGGTQFRVKDQFAWPMGCARDDSRSRRSTRGW